MREQASDITPTVNLLATSNTRPSWDDPHGALAGRIFEVMLQQPPQLDSSVPDRMKGEMHFILLLWLRSYYDLSRHVKNTPFKQWQHPCLTESRRMQEVGHPLAAMLMEGEATVSMGGMTVTVRPEQGATLNLARLQAILDEYCTESRCDRVTILGKKEDAALRAQLKRISDLLHLSNAAALKLVNQKFVFLCKTCKTDVNGIGEPRDMPGGNARTLCPPGCSTQCPVGCNSPTSAYYAAYKRHVKRSTRIVKPAYIKNLRATEEGAMDGMFGAE